ncbi:MAG: low molecular weight protein-tyrosine-phosphatase [Flavobacteriaceae bacterium]
MLEVTTTQKFKVLMVCLGNICRSPLAEGILKTKISLLGINYIEVASAGTDDYHLGSSPDGRSVAIANEFNVDISNQKSRHFKVTDFDEFDLIYVMDKSNYSDVLALARNKNDKQKVKLILNELYPKQDKEVPDPYYGGDKGFENVYKMLDKACESLLTKLILINE